MALCARKTSTQGEEGPRVQGQPGLCSKALAQKKKKEEKERKKKASIAIVGEMVTVGALPPPYTPSLLPIPHTRLEPWESEPSLSEGCPRCHPVKDVYVLFPRLSSGLFSRLKDPPSEILLRKAT